MFRRFGAVGKMLVDISRLFKRRFGAGVTCLPLLSLYLLKFGLF